MKEELELKKSKTKCPDCGEYLLWFEHWDGRYDGNYWCTKCSDYYVMEEDGRIW